MIKEFEKNKTAFVAMVKELAASEELSALAERARTEKKAEDAFAAVFLAVREGLGLTPFDTQLLAGAELDDDAAVELATGEGKTIAAVFAAFYSVVLGEHVNIFTFSDYLAQRDCRWMKPVYDLLGVSVSCVLERTPRSERAEKYRADVVYSTVRECGFDYLRDFLAFDADELVSGAFDRAIVDEADSLLIDEARIPLVAAGSVAVEQDAELPKIFEYAKTLSERDFEVSEETESAYLTDEGARRTEKRFGLKNLYDEENNALMTRLNDSLKALHVLAENRDYIVKNGEICLIDAFTGRAAEGRHFPGTLQSAVELKHGLEITERGTILAQIAVQNFVRLFRRVSGMTGTAASASDEFDEMYGLVVKRVEPNTPPRRIDLPMAAYYDETSKLSAAAEEIARAHEKGQPVLIGTNSIEQSEALSQLLGKKNIPHSVLNAKNDEAEAEIISGAGKPGAVTISANMAGRGVDIKLGGADETEREKVLDAGGLYVIGVFLAESARINDQLSGRAARQGDPGQSRLFVSLDEQIMTKYKLKKLVSGRHWPEPTSEELTDKILLREISRIQRISQGKTLDERVRLMKFHTINEKHRQMFFDARQGCLTGEKPCRIWEQRCPELLAQAMPLPKDFEKRAMLSVLTGCWADYLEYASALREGIHLSVIGGKDPAEEYNIACENYYLETEREIAEKMEEILSEAAKNGAGTVKLPVPAKVWTYLLADNGDELERRSLMSALFGGDTEDYEDQEEYEDSGEYAETEEADNSPKKGFFAKLFGKK